jgi:predicted nucleotidyltransferase
VALTVLRIVRRDSLGFVTDKGCVRRAGERVPGGSSSPLDRLRSAVDRITEATVTRPLTGLTHQDADDDVGTLATDDAVGFDPFPVLRALHNKGAKVVVIGQVAGIMHGSTELTGDLDLLWTGDDEDLPAVLAALEEVKAELSDEEGASIPCDKAALGLPKVLFRACGSAGDCCTSTLPWGELPVRGFIEGCAVAEDEDGLQVRYLALPHLITMRRTVARSKDRRRALELEYLLSLRRGPAVLDGEPRE